MAKKIDFEQIVNSPTPYDHYQSRLLAAAVVEVVAAIDRLTEQVGALAQCHEKERGSFFRCAREWSGEDV